MLRGQNEIAFNSDISQYIFYKQSKWIFQLIQSLQVVVAKANTSLKT